MSPILQAELFEPGLYLEKQGPGFFSILAKPSGIARQNSYELRLLPRVVESVDPTIDTYISQATFRMPNRLSVNLSSVGLLFTDLDTYESEGLRGKTPEQQAALLLLYCGQEEIPTPSLILFSGRGLQAKWLLDEAIGPANLAEWNQAQLSLVRILEPFAADVLSKDISRVLRLDHTVNTKSGEVARVLHVAGGHPDCIAHYSFEELREILLEHCPKLNPSAKPKAAKSTKTTCPVLSLPRKISLQRLNWYRLYDLRDLWALRRGVPEGYRELTLFWELNFLLRAKPVNVGQMWNEAQGLAAEIGSEWFRKEVRRSTLSTLYRKAQETAGGVRIEFQGRTYPPLYTPRNQTLIDLFSITPEEERHLRTIISREEKLRRLQEKRRAAGAKPREEYEALALSNIRPWEALGISRRWWYKRRELGL